MSDVIAFDKQQWHLDHESFPKGLPAVQAAIYGGFAFTWFYFNGLADLEFEDDWSEELDLLRQRRITPARFFQMCGGVFASDMLNDRGNAIAKLLFESQDIDFYELFEKTLCTEVPTPYHVEDTWHNYDRISSTLTYLFGHTLGS